MEPGAADPGPPPVGVLLDRWVARGLLTEQQADLLRADAGLPPGSGTPPAPPAPPARQSLLSEALGYLGGVLVLVAGVVLASRVWDDLSTGARLGLVAAVALLLLGASASVPHGAPARERLRSVLRLASTAAVALLCGLTADAVGLDDGADVALAVAAGTAAYALVLWLLGRSVLQQLALLASALLLAGSLAAQLGEDRPAPGVAVWGAALAWLALARGGLLDPPRSAVLGGCVGAIVGALMTTFSGDGWYVLAVVTVVGVVVAGVRLGDLAVLAVGALGALQVLPRLVSDWFPGDVAAPAVLLVVGVVLLVTAVRVAQHPRERPATRQRAAGPLADRAGSVRLAAGTVVVTALLTLLTGLG